MHFENHKIRKNHQTSAISVCFSWFSRIFPRVPVFFDSRDWTFRRILGISLNHQMSVGDASIDAAHRSGPKLRRHNAAEQGVSGVVASFQAWTANGDLAQA